MLTGNKNIDFEVLLKLDDKDFFKFAAKLNSFKESELPFELTNKYINKLCKDENLWRRRLFKLYVRNGIRCKLFPQDGQTWKNLYLKLIYYFDKYDYRKYPINVSLLQASEYGHLEVVKYFCQFKRNVMAFKFASVHGHSEVVNYLQKYMH